SGLNVSACRVFSCQNPGYNGLHQAARIATSIPAHEPADGIAGGIQSRDRFLIEIQSLTAPVHQHAPHSKGDTGHNLQTVIRGGATALAFLSVARLKNSDCRTVRPDCTPLLCWPNSLHPLQFSAQALR